MKCTRSLALTCNGMKRLGSLRTHACRSEEAQEAKEAAAFEAATQARAIVKTWKKPRLTPGHTSLPLDLWAMVLEHVLTEDSLWDLQATVQGLCHVSQTCKDLHLAVQQRGWPRLCQLLSPLPMPPTLRGKDGVSPPPDQDKLVNDPATLHVPQLRAACKFYMLPCAGQSRMLGSTAVA